MAKALSVRDFTSKKYDLYKFEGEWEAFLNQPESKGIWFIWGNSGNGKSSFTYQLAKYLASFDKVLYNSLEEGVCKTVQDKIIQHRLIDVKDNFQLICEPIPELQKRLDKRNSAQIIIIDSLRYTGLNWKTYLEFKNRNPNKTIIFIGHAKGKNPKGNLAEDIMYDAYIKIWVEGYRAISKGREIGRNGGLYTVWHEGENRYWGEPLNNEKN